VASVGEEAVGASLLEGRIGEERGGERLEGEADPEFLRHVGFGRIIEVHLDGAGAEHHVEAERADPRHVAEHDLVPALGHSRQSVAGLVGPHAEAEEAEAELVAHLLDLVEMAARLGAGLVEVLERRARQFELPGRLQADVPVLARQRDDLAAFLDRPPAIFGQRREQVADTAGLVVGGRAMIVAAVDELLVLGPDPPRRLGLLAARERGEQVLAALDRRVHARGFGPGRHCRPLAPAA
jgi:hypothetical protein